MKRTWMITLLLILIVVALLLAACGGDGATPVISGGPPDTTDTTTTTISSSATTATTLGGPPTTTTTTGGAATTGTTAATTSTAGAGPGPTPAVDPAEFSASVTNQYFPLVYGSIALYDVTTTDGAGEREVSVLTDTRMVMGVECVMVLNVVRVGDELREEIIEWYAEDGEGNVWCFGKQDKHYEKGRVVSTAGSWEAGVNGAVPGIVMEADPKTGHIYRQGYLRGQAEDMAEVLELGVSVEIPFGSFGGVLRIKEWSPLEPGVTLEKFFAPGQGLIKVMQVEGGSAVEVLTDFFCP